MLSILRNKLLTYSKLIVLLTVNPSGGLCYKLTDWFCVSQQLKLNGLRAMKKFGFDFNCKLIPEAAIENLSTLCNSLFQKNRIVNICLDEEPCTVNMAIPIQNRFAYYYFHYHYYYYYYYYYYYHYYYHFIVWI